MLLKAIKLTNFLSYGDHSETIRLERLNVIIGANGSGKSNLLEAIEFIKSAPKDLIAPIRDGGGVRDWLWKGAEIPMPASVEVVIDYPANPPDLRYSLSFTEVSQGFEILDERVEGAVPVTGHQAPYLYYKFENGHGVLNIKGKNRKLQREDIEPNQSILSQRKDP